MSRKETTRKICIYALCLVVIFLFQTPRGVLGPLRVLGINLLPGLIACVAMYEGPLFASSMGFFAGFIFSIGTGDVPGVTSVFYILFGAVSGVFMDSYMREIAISPFICSLFGSICAFVLSYVFYYGILYQGTIFYAAMQAAISVAASAIFFPLTYFIVKRVSGGGAYD